VADDDGMGETRRIDPALGVSVPDFRIDAWQQAFEVSPHIALAFAGSPLDFWAVENSDPGARSFY
jgi:hypothetical protein